MNKSAWLVMAVMVVAAVGASGMETNLGVHASGGIDALGLPVVIGFDFRAWPYPLQIGLGLMSISGTMLQSLSLEVDWWLLEGRLGDLPLGWYVGGGLLVIFPIFAVGVRAPLGLLWWPLADRGFELHLDAMPSASALVYPFQLFRWSVEAGIGARWWFGR